MGVLKYALKRIKLFNNERFDKHIDIIAKNTGKSKTYIKLNWIWNLIIYGVGYTDYFRGDYINLKHKEKLTFVTSKSFYKILRKLNDKEYEKYLSNKLLFNEMFKDYIKRDYIDIRNTSMEEFERFVEGKSVVFAKVVDGFGGHGVSKININPNLDIQNKYNELMQNEQFLVEDAIIQSDEVNEINPNVVNSFRVVTLYHDEKADVIANALRVNQDANNVIGCTNDLYFSLSEDGIIDSNVIDDYGNIYEEHPLTHKKFKEVKIKGVKEAFEMCKEAALKLPQVRYIGWDVGFTNNGPCIIEGNEYPGYGIIQFYKLKNSRTGHKKQIMDVIGKI